VGSALLSQQKALLFVFHEKAKLLKMALSVSESGYVLIHGKS
jgi:hypothetical protein